MDDDIVIGIDLGTTNSCAAYHIHGKTRIITNKENQRTTPSVVFFSEENQVIVGEYAKKLAIVRPEAAVFEIKRLVGRHLDDPHVQKNLRFYPYKLDDASQDSVIIIENSGKTVKKNCTEICAAILSKIKADVEDKLGHSLQRAVITVPAYFNVKQREVTLTAAEKAGFVVLKLLNEPTAAALTYYFEKKDETELYSLVYDLGGGTFDVAVLKRRSENFEIISVDGDSHLGGQDLDNLIIDYVWKQLKQQFNVRNDRRKMRRLATLCEEAKKILSVTEETSIILNGFVRDHDEVHISFTRSQFEDMANDLLNKTISIVDDCLRSCNVNKNQIQEVIIAGGSTRIPRIEKLLIEYFGRNNLKKQINQDECVAEGAALQAAMLSAHPSQKILNIKVTDVVPLSLGISTLGGIMNFLIRRNTPIPVKVSEIRTTVYDKQKNIAFKIYEGERLNARKNRFLGKLDITNLTPAPPRQCQVSLTMSVDINGILIVSAQEKYKNNVKDLKVTYTRGHASDSEVRNTLKDAQDHEKEDVTFLRFVKENKYLVHYCVGVIHNLENKKLKSSYQNVYKLCKQIKEEAEKAHVEDIEKIRRYVTIVREQCDGIITKHKFQFIPVYEN